MLIVACTMMAGAAQAQTDQTVMQNGETAYDMVDDMPRYPGGYEALFKFLAYNVQYPKVAFEAGIGGRVIVDFVIDKEGNLVEPCVQKSIHPLLDAEALRVVRAMPKWIAGLKDGKPVNVKFTLPIMFNITDGEKDAKEETK